MTFPARAGTWLDEIVRRGGAFVTGTGTGVGKTVVTAAIGAALQRRSIRVGAFKPISTGGLMSADGIRLKRALRLREPSACVAPVNFSAPVSPLVAAALARRTIRWRNIFSGYRWWRKRYPVVLVEGVGGVLVPLDRGWLVTDLIERFNLPVIVVGRAGLGTVNHTLLTLEALSRRRLPVMGVVLNGFTGRDRSEQTNAKVIESCSGIPVLAQLPFKKSLKRRLNLLSRDLAGLIGHVETQVHRTCVLTGAPPRLDSARANTLKRGVFFQ